MTIICVTCQGTGKITPDKHHTEECPTCRGYTTIEVEAIPDGYITMIENINKRLKEPPKEMVATL